MICRWLHPLNIFIILCVVCFLSYLIQRYIVTGPIAARDPSLYKELKGDNYKGDATGLYGGLIQLKVLKGLWGRKELTDYFKFAYYCYLIASISIFLLGLLFCVSGLAYDSICR